MELSAVHALHTMCEERGLQDEWKRLCAAAMTLYHENVDRGIDLTTQKERSTQDRTDHEKAIHQFEQARNDLGALFMEDLASLNPIDVYEVCREVK
jgi:hypothetical protein